VRQARDAALVTLITLGPVLAVGGGPAAASDTEPARTLHKIEKDLEPALGKGWLL